MWVRKVFAFGAMGMNIIRNINLKRINNMKQTQYKYKIVSKFETDLTLKGVMDSLEQVLNNENKELELANIIECDTFFVMQWQY
jgi:hypothetical protein